MAGKIAYFILSEDEIHLGYSENDHFQWIEKFSFANKTDFYYKEQLQQLIDKHNFHNSEYEEHLLMWYSPVSTLIPMNLLENSNPKTLLEYSFSDQKLQYDADYNRIPELSIINIYEIPLWVKSFFVMRFPKIVMQHLGTGLIRGIFNTGSFKPTVHLFLAKQYALMLFVKHNELKLYNSFEYSNENDLIYYTLNALTQVDALNDSGAIILHSLADDDSAITEAFTANWAKLIDGQNFKTEIQKVQTLNYLATCV